MVLGQTARNDHGAVGVLVELTTARVDVFPVGHWILRTGEAIRERTIRCEGHMHHEQSQRTPAKEPRNRGDYLLTSGSALQGVANRSALSKISMTVQACLLQRKLWNPGI